MARICHLKPHKKLKEVGFGILAHGFYLIWILDVKIKTKEINGIISILESEATPDNLDK